MTEVSSGGPNRVPASARRGRVSTEGGAAPAGAAIERKPSETKARLKGFGEEAGLLRQFEDALVSYRHAQAHGSLNEAAISAQSPISLEPHRGGDHPPDAVALVAVEPDGVLRFLSVSPAAGGALGGDGKKNWDLSGLTLSDVLAAYPYHATLIEQKYRECIQSNAVVRFSWRNRSLLGDTIREINLLPISGPDGKVALIVVHWCERPSTAALEKEWETGEVERLTDRLQALMAGISDGCITINRAWRITGMNEHAAAWYGAPVEKLLGTDLRRGLATRMALGDLIEEVLTTRKPVLREFRSTTREGRWAEIHIRPTSEGACIAFRDITARVNARQETVRQRDLLQGALDAIQKDIVVFDEKGKVIAANARWLNSPDPLPGFAVANDLGAGSGRVYEALTQMLETGQTSLIGPGPKGPHEDAWHQFRVSSFQSGGARHVILTHEDVSEVVRARRALKESADRSIEIQNEERRRIALELHDSTVQHLVAASLGLSRLERLSRDNPAAKAIFDDVRSSVDEAQKEIRTMSYLLHPPDLSRNGLPRTVRKFAEGFARRSGISVQVRMRGMLRNQTEDAERMLFRVLQEALVNVHRHSAATDVRISLAATKSGARLRIRDNGKGIAFTRRTTGGADLGVGIPGMRERVARLNGDFRIGSGSWGTAIRVTIPLGAEGADQGVIK